MSSHLNQAVREHVVLSWERTTTGDRYRDTWRRVSSDGVARPALDADADFQVGLNAQLVVTDVTWSWARPGVGDPSEFQGVVTLQLWLLAGVNPRGWQPEDYYTDQAPVFVTSVDTREGARAGQGPSGFVGVKNVALTAGFTVSPNTMIHVRMDPWPGGPMGPGMEPPGWPREIRAYGVLPYGVLLYGYLSAP